VSQQHQQEKRLQYNPDGYLFIKRRVLPRLLEMGASSETVHMLNENNPRRFFEG
jgi:predicted metal-dependent phosphotriesterase family hydrolase